MTSIEWTNETWNPVTGCTKISPGCRNCYAETVAGRFWKTQYAPVWTPAGRQRSRRFTDVQSHPERLEQPLRWRTPRRVFVNSMSDLFHEAVSYEFIDQVFAVMALATQHSFQILTKRPERMSDYCGSHVKPLKGVTNPWPLPNVWLGVSAEDQQRADERIPLLLQTPAAVRFVSLEPLLGPVDIRGPRETCGDCDRCIGGRPDQCTSAWWTAVLHPAGIQWVIVGGESGAGARPCDVAWIRSIIHQCREAEVPCFVKQLGVRPYDSSVTNDPERLAEQVIGVSGKGGNPNEWPDDLRVRDYP